MNAIEFPVRKELFWDINQDDFDVERNRRLIIERVFSLGTLQELKFIMTLYDRETIREELMKVGYLDPKTFNFAVHFYNIPKKQMRCYIRKRSRPQHWI